MITSQKEQQQQQKKTVVAKMCKVPQWIKQTPPINSDINEVITIN